MTGSRAVQPARGTQTGTSFAAKLAVVLRRRHGTAPSAVTASALTAGFGADVLNALPFEIAVLAADGTIEAVNDAWRAAAERAGVSRDANAFVGKNYLDVCRNSARRGNQEAADAGVGIAAVLNGSSTWYQAVYDMSSENVERHFEVQAVPRRGGGAVLTHMDVTARVRAERDAMERARELLHVSRAVTAGTLSGALTHELSQPLTAILANAQAALHMLDAPERDDHALRDAVRDTIRSVQRASEIVQRTRNLLKRDVPARQHVDVNEVVQETTRTLMNEALLRGVRLTVLRALDLPLVYGSPVELQQCVMNLILNGFDAMADIPPVDRHLLVHTGRAGRGGVEIVIEDRGNGIDPNRLDRIFDPFYTTKRNGMGMGLYVTREIVRSHGGRITVKRNPDRGMRFRIVLPRADDTGDRATGISVP